MCVYVNLADDKKPIESNNKSHGLLIQNLRGFRLKLTILVNFKDNIHENYLYVKSYLKKELGNYMKSEVFAPFRIYT